MQRTLMLGITLFATLAIAPMTAPADAASTGDAKRSSASSVDSRFSTVAPADIDKLRAVMRDIRYVERYLPDVYEERIQAMPVITRQDALRAEYRAQIRALHAAYSYLSQVPLSPAPAPQSGKPAEYTSYNALWKALDSCAEDDRGYIAKAKQALEHPGRN